MTSSKIRLMVLWSLAGIAGLFMLALLLAWISSSFHALNGWLNMLGFVLVATALVAGVWGALIRQEKFPRWMLSLLIGAALLRLAVGATWSVVLPRYGYASAAELKGYVMSDAHKRDQAAWDLAKSKKSLLAAFKQYRKADQYGGTLFLSAALYRLLGGESHQPLALVLVTAGFSALAVPIAWAFTRRAWQEHPHGERLGWLAAWGIALYPEAVLLGSSQMREAFLIPLCLAAFYGLAHFRQRHSWIGATWILSGLLLATLISPPAAGLIVLALVGVGLIWGIAPVEAGIMPAQDGSPGASTRLAPTLKTVLRKRWLIWSSLVILVLAIVLVSWFSVQRLAGRSFANPLEAFSWWLRYSAQWQSHLVERSSGWVQAIFRSTPGWMHTPFLLAYGTVQPFLPAALLDLSGAWVWRLIAIWRSLGWTLLLPLLLYAPVCALRKGTRDRLAIGLSLVIWLGILINALRGGGDAWDNVRYRAVFAGLQISLAAWGWMSYRTTGDPWLRRALILVIAVLAWFIPWYLMRYAHMPWLVTSPFWTLVLGLLTAGLIITWDVLRKNRTRLKK